MRCSIVSSDGAADVEDEVGGGGGGGRACGAIEIAADRLPLAVLTAFRIGR